MRARRSLLDLEYLLSRSAKPAPLSRLPRHPPRTEQARRAGWRQDSGVDERRRLPQLVHHR
jgi:hypothetical protein